jgi:DNA-directed RNA polymerase specialized sigma24 family protein
MSDETYLIEAAKQGNTEAFDRLWARHRDKVFRSLLRACGGDPDTTHDVLQDALLNAFQSAPAVSWGRELRHLALYYRAAAVHPRPTRVRPILLAGRPAEHGGGAGDSAPTD